MKHASIIIIRLYQRFFSPDHGIVFPNRVRACRFLPSCSEYAIEALYLYGFIKGWFLIGSRLLRCHPWQKGGYDPVIVTSKK